MRYSAIDVFTPNEFEINDSGFLIAPGNIARTGVQTYYAYEFGLEDRKPNDPVVLYRPPEEVFDQASMNSFENSPVTVGHPSEWVNPANWSHLAKGEAVNVTKVNDTYLRANIVVKSQDAIDLIKKGKKQLSNGYMFTLDWTEGVTPEGTKYDGVQRNIRGNHVAIVDQARCGSACRIFDSEPQPEEARMADRKIVVDGIPVEVNDAAAAVIEKLQQQVADSLKRSADAEAKVGEFVIVKLGDASVTYTGEQVVQQLKARDEEIANLKQSVMTPEQRDAMVADWATLLADAAKLAPAVTTQGKDCETIRREVLASVVSANDNRAKLVATVAPDLKVATGDQLKTAFKVAITATPESTQASDTNVGKHFSTGASDNSVQLEQPMGRDNFLMKSANAWQGEQK